MTDTTYPTFEQYNPVTAAYLRTLLQPYHDALTAADSIEGLTEWVPLVLPESAEELNAVITQTGDVEQGKIIILQTLASVLANPENTNVTPWDIARYRSDIAVRLFGPGRDTIPVVVTNGPNVFQHELTEELTYGLLVGLDVTPGPTLSIGGVEIVPEIFGEKFTDPNRETANYVAVIGDRSIYFDTRDFVQGVITAGDWIARDPHTIITSLVQIDAEDNEIPLNF